MEKIPNSLDTGIENTFIDSNPVLTLKVKNADVSYEYMGSTNNRYRDVYIDQNKNTWIEINRSPRRQMLVSLLSQPFFNISTVVELPNKVGKISNFVSKVNPQISELFTTGAKKLGIQQTTFASKVMNTEKLYRKSTSEMMADYIVFNSIFEGTEADRAFDVEHNIIRTHSTYALFDFESQGILPAKHFEKLSEDSDAKDRLSGCIYKIKKMLWYESRPIDIGDVPAILKVVQPVVKKLIEIEDFYSGESGEKFFGAVMKKTKYQEEVQNDFLSGIRTAKKHGSVDGAVYCDQGGNWSVKSNEELASLVEDPSYYDQHELTQGLLLKINYMRNVLSNELTKFRDELIPKGLEPDKIDEINSYIAQL